MVGWLEDHRGKYVIAVGGLALLLGWFGRVEMPNPISDQLMPVRVHVLAVLMAATTAPMAVRSQVAAKLWVDSSRRMRLGWFVALVLLGGATSWLARLPDHGAWAGRLYLVGALWGVSVTVALVWSEAAGLLCIFVVFAAYVVTPNDGARHLWSPLVAVQCPPLLDALGALALSTACLVYVSNRFGHRRF